MIQLFKFILSHPLTKHRPVSEIFNALKWQLISRLRKKPIIHQFTPNSRLWVWRGLTGATGNIYCGLHEFEDMAFLLHFLRKTDLFVDIGANIGSYTILASSEVGARTIAIEPVPETFNYLLQNIDLNKIVSHVIPLNMAAGSTKGILHFTDSLDTGNHVVKDSSNSSLIVDVNSLDKLLENESPALLKIDVEGFETEVVNGAEQVLSSPNLKAIIIELNGSGKRYGFDEEQIHRQLSEKGFKAYQYLPFARSLKETSRNTVLNTIYIKDFDFVLERLQQAEKIKVKGTSF